MWNPTRLDRKEESRWEERKRDKTGKKNISDDKVSISLAIKEPVCAAAWLDKMQTRNATHCLTERMFIWFAGTTSCSYPHLLSELKSLDTDRSLLKVSFRGRYYKSLGALHWHADGMTKHWPLPWRDRFTRTVQHTHRVSCGTVHICNMLDVRPDCVPGQVLNLTWFQKGAEVWATNSSWVITWRHYLAFNEQHNQQHISPSFSLHLARTDTQSNSVV